MNRPQFSFVVFFSLLLACDDVSISPLMDAGQLDDGYGVVPNEIFEPDAGIEPSDAGVEPTCRPLTNNQAIPWECEDDVDWCDPVGDAERPAADLLATWSFLDGDEFVYQMRFSGMPFYDAVQQTISFAALNAPLVDPQGRGGVNETGDPSTGLEGNFSLVLTEQFVASPSPWQYPPRSDLNEYTLAGQVVGGCDWSLHPSLPLVELRVPAFLVLPDEDVPPTYGVDVSPCILPQGLCEASWPTLRPQAVVSHGGRSADSGGLVSICELGCPIVMQN